MAGFDQHNSTHCYHCDPGYGIDEDFNCSPICKQPCVSGKCIGPNICGCSSGFRLKDPFTCEPVCDKPCVNSLCTSPNVCSCFNGYIEVNDSCVPYCDSCANGRCVEPNVCDCDDGYGQVNGSCVPACDKVCVNGFCSAPNLCTCEEGYLMDDSGHKCHKPCDEKCPDACDEHGKCIDCSIPLRYVQLCQSFSKSWPSQMVLFMQVMFEPWMYQTTSQTFLTNIIQVRL